MISVDAVRQDASQLHSFIEQLVQMCSNLRDDYPVFRDPSIKFFGYIATLGLKTQEYLEGFPAFYAKSTDKRAADSKRQKLVSLKTAWETLHNYIKPTLDADSLHLPMSLVTAFGDIVNSVDDWRDYKFVLFHTTEANYLQIPSGMARKAANDIAESVDCERFDSNLGLVGIPYSQSSGLFLNCLLPHEFSHFIYQEHADDLVEAQIESFLEKVLGENSLEPEGLAWCLRELGAWVEETFCDLLAICMIGPAFSLALVQLFAASALVDRPDGEPPESYEFSEGYPADVARLHFHRKLLINLGWWEVIRDWRCSSIQAINKCEIWSPLINIEGYLPDGVTQEQLLLCYQNVCDWMLGYCSESFSNVATSVHEYEVQAPIISLYLARAIVPSTIILGKKQLYPNPVVLINAGFYFLLEKLSTLVENIERENSLSVETRSRIGARLQLWVLKAIEDNRLLMRQEVK